MLQIGDTIPDLSLKGFYKDDIIDFHLGQFKKKWLIILFYPADFTFVCPTELEEAAEYYNEFKKIGAEVVSVSTDTAFVHKAWHDESKAIAKVKFPMLSDPTAAMCKEFGTYKEDEGLSYRATFIIDPDQKVIAIDKHDNSIGRSAAEILRKLQAADFVRQNGGAIVCPASWNPGEKTLKPGVDLVGKI